MVAHDAADEQLGALFAGFEGDGLLEEEGVAYGAVDDAVEDVREGFALWGDGGLVLSREWKLHAVARGGPPVGHLE